MWNAPPLLAFLYPTSASSCQRAGGKTLLGAAALERLNQNTGLVLWMVPSDAIYKQTWNALKNRQHPYRQMLERGSGGRVKILEKGRPVSPPTTLRTISA